MRREQVTVPQMALNAKLTVRFIDGTYIMLRRNIYGYYSCGTSTFQCANKDLLDELVSILAEDRDGVDKFI